MSETKKTDMELLAEQQRKLLQEVYDDTIRGKLILTEPIREADETFDALFFDFTAITGSDFINAINADRANTSTEHLSIQQCMSLFISAVLKDERNKRAGVHLDARDIMSRMDWQSMQQARKVTDAFFRSSSLLGGRNTVKE